MYVYNEKYSKKYMWGNMCLFFSNISNDPSRMIVIKLL